MELLFHSCPEVDNASNVLLDSSKSVHEYIMEIRDNAAQMKSLKVEILSHYWSISY
jgi:hypothetical protein